MKLQGAVQVERFEIFGGGPGSGRHAEVLQKHGWEQTKKNSAGTQWVHNQHSGPIAVGTNGNWNHKRGGYGSGADSLDTYLTGLKKIGEGMAAARGCKGANCGRRSKAPGGGHLPKHSRVSMQEKDTLISRSTDGLTGGGPGSGRHKEGNTLKDHVAQGKFKGGWKAGGRSESKEGWSGYHTSFYDHPKHGLLEIKHGGPFRENPVTVRHNGSRVFTGGHDATRAFLRNSYGIRYGTPDSH